MFEPLRLYCIVFIVLCGQRRARLDSANAESNQVFPCPLTKPNEPEHGKTYNKTCVTSKDSNQPVHPPSMARVLVHHSLDCPEAVEGTCDQRRLRLDCAISQADLSLRLSHKSYCRFCRALTQFPKTQMARMISIFTILVNCEDLFSIGADQVENLFIITHTIIDS